MIVRGSEFSSTDSHMTLTNRIAAVHVVYDSICEELYWFGQLTSQYPGIVSSLLSQRSLGEEGMVGAGGAFHCFPSAFLSPIFPKSFLFSLQDPLFHPIYVHTCISFLPSESPPQCPGVGVGQLSKTSN